MLVNSWFDGICLYEIKNSFGWRGFDFPRPFVAAAVASAPKLFTLVLDNLIEEDYLMKFFEVDSTGT